MLNRINLIATKVQIWRGKLRNLTHYFTKGENTAQGRSQIALGITTSIILLCIISILLLGKLWRSNDWTPKKFRLWAMGRGALHFLWFLIYFLNMGRGNNNNLWRSTSSLDGMLKMCNTVKILKIEKLEIIVIIILNLSLVTRKPVFGVFNQVKLKPACSAKETS